MYEIRRISKDLSEYTQGKLVAYLKKITPDDLLINATISYPQFKDESKKLKLFLLDIINGDNDPVRAVVGNIDKFIA